MQEKAAVHKDGNEGTGILPVKDFCVLIPFYNNRLGLIRSLQSICYSPVKFSVLIIDDGSDEPLTVDDLAEYLHPDLHINIIRLPRNGGITMALNAGLKHLSEKEDCRYIARLDCGDVCKEDRFLQQVKFLNEHPDIDLVGSWCIFKDYSTGEAFEYIVPTSHKGIMREMHFKNVFIHPSVMWRAEAVAAVQAYPDSFPHAEDYAFFYELLRRGKGAVLPQFLVVCEISRAGLSISYRKQQLLSRLRVVRHYRESVWYGMLGEARLRLLMLLSADWALKIKKRIRRVQQSPAVT
jgi:glycosyltransferase involved in cell wall biosynthesis